MRKLLYGILIMGFVFLFNGCNKSPTPEPQADTSSLTAPARYRITYQWTLLSNDSVGNDWEQTVTCDGQAVASGHIVTDENGSAVTIHGTVTENDKHPDTGSGTVTLTLADGASSSVHITVCEGHGTYAGNTAEWELICRAVRKE